MNEGTTVKPGMSNGRAQDFRRRLVLGTALATSAFLGGYRGYVRRAYADCTGAGGTYTCSGATTTTQTLTGAPLVVTTDPGFSIDTTGSGGNAFTLSGNGGMTFTDNNQSTIIGAGDGFSASNTDSGALSITTTGSVTGTNGDGMNVTNYGPATDLAIAAVDVSGEINGVSALNNGSGALSITATGTVTGEGLNGIAAIANGPATDLAIAAVDVSGGYRGIFARNSGSGALSITATGTVAGTDSVGIDAFNYGTDLTIEAADVSGGRYGIRAHNDSGGALSITATGTVSGTSWDGIVAYANGGTDMTIEAADVSGGQDGIAARNYGTGALSITATGTVMGTSHNGINAYAGSSTTDLMIEAADISGAANGIDARNYGSGALSITTSGAVTGTNSGGIYARNAGTDLTIAATEVSGAAGGIDALNNGTGTLSITASGAVTGETGDGIFAGNNGTGTDLTIEAADVSGGNHGIDAYNQGSGALSITTTGVVTATNGVGIEAFNGSSTTTDLTIEAADVSGGTAGIFALNDGSGAFSITTTGAVTGGAGDGILVSNDGAGTDLTIAAADVSGGASGINATNNGSGTLAITTTGLVTGTSYDGIFAHAGSNATGLTIAAVDVGGGTYGIEARNYGSGALSITTSGAVTGNGHSGIYAVNNSAASDSTTTVTVEDGSAVNGATAGVELLSTTGRAAGVDNAGSITGATGILASGGPATISNTGTVTGNDGAAIDLTAAGGPNTVNQQGGTISGDILLSAAPDIVNVTGGAISGDITGQGNAETNFALGSGTFTVGTPFAITGMADVNINSGTVVVDGSIESAATTVADGARLGGSGSIAGPVTVEDGGTIAPGSSPGTLTVGSLALNGGSILDYQLGQAGVVGGGVNDLIEVTGNLVLDGTLNVTDVGGFGPGVYRLINYGGTLADHVLELGSLPSGVEASDLYVQTRIGGQVNLISSVGAVLNFWDGGDTELHDNGVNDGGNGVWDATNRNWTEADGMPNGLWNQDFAIFGGTAGTVTVDNSAGAVQFTGMQFMTDGYVIDGDALTTNTAETIIRTDAGVTAEIAAEIAGSGGLVKTDTGTLVLSGANSFTGGTTVNAGMLTAAVTGALGTGPVSIDAASGTSAEVEFTGSAHAGTLAIGLADLSSSLSFAQNASAGAATIDNSGQVYFHDTASAGTVTIMNDPGGRVSFNGNSTADDAAIANTGYLEFFESATAGNATITNSSGHVMFWDHSTADGATIVNSGEVDISELTADGIGIGSLSDAGAVYLGSKSLTLGGLGTNDTISGVIQDGGSAGETGGSLVKVGTGTLTLTGENSFTGGTTINAGTLDIGGGGATGSIAGNVDVAAGGTLAFNRSNDFTFAGTIGGNGAVEKLAAGTLTLTGNSSAFTGATSVNTGTLTVDGTLGGTLNVASGARLAGIGTVGTTTIASGGTIAPGRSPGTMSVNGDITFASGSTYAVDITPALDGDLIDASGSATIDGGTVNVLKAAGTYTPGSRWTILSADGGVTGTFDTLTQNMPFVDLALAYDPDNVYLDVARNAVSFCDVAGTRNQCSTGNGVESTGQGNPIYDAVAAIPDEDSARQALDSLSGEIHASIQGAMLEDSRFVREAALDRTRAALGGVAVTDFPVMGYGPDELTPEQQEALAREGKSARVFAPAAADTDRFVMWARGFGSWGKWDSDGNAADFERSIGGIFIGADAPVGDWRIGALAGYSHSSFHADDRASSGESDDYHLGIYAGTEWGNLGLRLGASHTWHKIETSRSIIFPGFADSAQASYDARTVQAFGELGYRIDRGTFAFEPFANLAYVNVHTDDFTEDGGAAALTGTSSNADATFTTLGLRAATDFSLGGTPVKARGTVGWRHAFGDVTPLTDFAFTGGDAFTIAGTPIAEDALVLEAGLDIGLSEKATLGLSYSGQIGDGAQDHGFRADFTVKF